MKNRWKKKKRKKERKKERKKKEKAEGKERKRPHSLEKAKNQMRSLACQQAGIARYVLREQLIYERE